WQYSERLRLFRVERRLVGFQLAGWRASGVKWESCWFFDVYIWRLLLFYTAIVHRLQFWLPFFTDFLAFFSFDSKINFHLNSSPSAARLALASDQMPMLTAPSTIVSSPLLPTSAPRKLSEKIICRAGDLQSTEQWIETSEHVVECFECFETDGERKTEENIPLLSLERLKMRHRRIFENYGLEWIFCRPKFERFIVKKSIV
ncbi:hypothetical protein Prudu_018486, partial [Prunus dulcis]